MLDWFEFAGKRSTDCGVLVTKLPPITLAEERVEFEEAIGRSGSLTILEGEAVYDDVILPVECRMVNLETLDDAAAWLRGSGRLVLPNREGGYYIGRVINKIEMERIIAASEDRAFTVNFRVQPYFYLDSSKDITITSASQVINNPGTAESKPRIAVYGSGDVGLMIGSQMVILKNLTDGILLDAELEDALALDASELLNGQLAGDCPIIPPGRSTVAWFPFEDDDNPGAVTRIVITPRWRCR